MIRVTTVHGRLDEIVQEFDTMEEARAVVESQERDRHGGRGFEEVAGRFTLRDRKGNLLQVGTDCHYIMFEEK
jgi:hypothetical protein